MNWKRLALQQVKLDRIWNVACLTMPLRDSLVADGWNLAKFQQSSCLLLFYIRIEVHFCLWRDVCGWWRNRSAWWKTEINLKHSLSHAQTSTSDFRLAFLTKGLGAPVIPSHLQNYPCSRLFCSFCLRGLQYLAIHYYFPHVYVVLSCLLHFPAAHLR